MSVAERVGGTISGLIDRARGLAGSVASGLGSYIPGRAMGGDVIAGNQYLVGERGPELFIPNASGSIVPNSAIGGRVELHAHFHGTVFGGNRDQVARELMDTFTQYIRGGGGRLPAFS